MHDENDNIKSSHLFKMFRSKAKCKINLFFMPQESKFFDFFHKYRTKQKKKSKQKGKKTIFYIESHRII